MNLLVALISVTLLISTIIFTPIVSRVSGVGMMDENETAARKSSDLQAQSTETGTSTTSPEAGTQPTTESSTTSTPPTEKGTSTPPTDVTETKDKEGNIVLSSTTQDLIITATVATRSIQEDLGLPEVAKEVAQQVTNEEKDYTEGLLKGAVLGFGENEEYAKYFCPCGMLTKRFTIVVMK